MKQVTSLSQKMERYLDYLGDQGVLVGMVGFLGPTVVLVLGGAWLIALFVWVLGLLPSALVAVVLLCLAFAVVRFFVRLWRASQREEAE